MRFEVELEHTIAFLFFFLNDPAPPETSPLPLPDALPIWTKPPPAPACAGIGRARVPDLRRAVPGRPAPGGAHDGVGDGARLRFAAGARTPPAVAAQIGRAHV